MSLRSPLNQAHTDQSARSSMSAGSQPSIQGESAALDSLREQREASLRATAGGPPQKTINPFFGVGPTTNMTTDELHRNSLRFEFEAWVEASYRKFDDRGRDMGAFTVGELERSMHRGHPADKIVLDMMRMIHGYFEFPKQNRIAVGLGGGHNGFTVALMHLMNPNDATQRVFVDTARAETPDGDVGGFFRQSWGAQILELQQFSRSGAADRLHFANVEGQIPSARELQALGITLFVGVGHETTTATTYNEQDVRNLLEWLDLEPASHHALIDGTSLLGAMPWSQDLVQAMLEKACFFMPFQKAMAGVPGYFAASFTPRAIELIERNVHNPAWAIPRHLKLAVPQHPKRPLTGEKTTGLGPFYDAAQDKMLGGIINTFSNLAFAETTFGILSLKRRVGSMQDLNRRSSDNRAAVETWIQGHPLFELGVSDASRRGAAVTLLKINDPSLGHSAALGARIIGKAKQLLSYEGLTHPNGEHEPGLDVARYVNAFPGTSGDFRAWIGGSRPSSDIVALLANIEYCYHRARVVVIEEELAACGITFESRAVLRDKTRLDDPLRAYKVLIVDPIALRSGSDGQPDLAEMRDYIETQGAYFHRGPLSPSTPLASGGIHFFYQPDLSREEEILAQTGQGEYDAVIAAATILPRGSVFRLGGVRIGAGTGNMRSDSWGGASGRAGVAPLMNTPSFNSRVTAQRVFQALLRSAPNLPVAELHRRVMAGEFDTGRHLKNYPTEKLEGKRLAILGFGNVGREVAKMAKAFSMDVVIYARAEAKVWCQSEGYGYASTPEEAAREAHFLTLHTGLGTEANGRFANEGFVGFTVLSQLNKGAVVINYDRGELIDAPSLGNALADGRVRFVCVDADIFVDSEGNSSGPMVPYLRLSREFPHAFELLPHAVADTDHISRVEGAKQAVEQIIRSIRYHELVNVKGEVPDGYTRVGVCTVRGVGNIAADRLQSAASDRQQVMELRSLSEHLAAFWKAVSTTESPERRAELIRNYGSSLVRDSNCYGSTMEALGLRGPLV